MAMEARHIGSLQVSVVGLGGNNFGSRLDAAATEAVVHAALDAGVTFFDTADVYGGTRSEEFLGQALGNRREEAVIATKFGSPIDDRRQGAKPDYVLHAAEDSLRRLGTDYIDLYQLHWPDPNVPIEDTLSALDLLVKAGKVREIGCSNFTVPQLRVALAAAVDGTQFASVQNRYNLLHRDPERDVIPECVRTGLAFIPYFPLANGLLTGKYRPDEPPPPGSRLATPGREVGLLTEHNLATVQALDEYAASRGYTVLELAVSWLAAQPAVASVIAGATTPQQVRANAAAASWLMTQEELAAIDTIVPPPGQMRRAA